MSSGLADEPQEDDEHPPDVAVFSREATSIGVNRLSKEIIGWFITTTPLGMVPEQSGKRRAKTGNRLISSRSPSYGILPTGSLVGFVSGVRHDEDAGGVRTA
jgi:hypothetical protein